MKKFSIKALLAVLILSAVSLYAQPVIEYKSLDELIPNTKQTVTGTLPNGLKYFIRQNKKPENRAELMIAVRAGSVYEDDDQQGLAHLCEHLCFNGTKNFPKDSLVKFLEGIGMKFGAELNAYTSFNETVYFLKVPTDNWENMEKAFQILEDWGHNVSFDPVEIDKERGVVLEEQRGGRGAGERVQNKHFPVLLKNSMYAKRLPIGDTNIIKNASYETIKRFYKDWYRPNLMAVIAVGDFDVEKVRATIVEKFSDMQNPKNERPREEVKIPSYPGVLVSIAKDKELTYSMINMVCKHEGMKKGTFAEYKNSVRNNLFNSMLNTRVQEITRKPNAPFLMAGAGEEGFLANLHAFNLIAITKPDQILNGFEGILNEVYRVQQHGFTQSEFDRTKKEIIRGVDKMLAEKDKVESDDLAQELKRHFTDGESYPGTEYDAALTKKFVNEITLAEVNEIAKKYLIKENAVITVSVIDKEGSLVPTEEQVIAKLDEVSAKKQTPYVDKVANKPLFPKEPIPGTITAEKEIPEIGATEWTLSNGMKLVLKPTDFKNDEIQVTGFSWGGTSLATDENYRTAENASSIMARGGVGKFDVDDLERMLAGKVAGAHTSIDDFTQDLSANCSPQDMETMFQLINLKFTEPRKDKEAFQSMIEKMKANIKNSETDPMKAFRDTVNGTMSNYHFRTMPYTVETVDQISLDKAFKFYRERFSNAGAFTLVFVGNFTKEKIKPMVEKYLASLPGSDTKEMWKDEGITYPKEKLKKVVYKGIEQKSAVRIYIKGDCEWTRKERLTAATLSEILNIRLRESIREDKSGTYGVGGRVALTNLPRPTYTTMVQFGCNPDRSEELVQAVIDVFEKMRKEPPTAEEMKKAKELHRRNREVGLKENEYWLSSIEQYLKNGEDLALIMDFEKRLDALTAEDVFNAAKKYLDISTMKTFIAMPEK